MPRELIITHFTQLPRTEVVCGAMRQRIIRHYPGGQQYLEWQEKGKTRNRFVGNEPGEAQTLVEGCRRCLGNDRRDCDIRPPYPGMTPFSYDPVPTPVEVLIPYTVSFDFDQLSNIQEAASQAGLKFRVLAMPGKKYTSDVDGREMICPTDKVRVSIGDGRYDEDENRRMREFWHNWNVLSGEEAKREASLNKFMQQT